jgi:hypothetical protein
MILRPAGAERTVVQATTGGGEQKGKETRKEVGIKAERKKT